MSDIPSQQSFYIKDCALAAMPTGDRAGSLLEFRDKLITVHPGCIYYHFWGSRLHSQFPHPEDQNDFATWAHHFLHDLYLAERLAVLDPTEYENIEDLRQEIINIIEDSIEEKEIILWVKKEKQFHFIRSKIVVFDTPLVMKDPSELVNIIPMLTTSSIFYHFIDARRRTSEAIDDFSVWLMGFGDLYLDLIHNIQSVDLYFLSLLELRQKLAQIISKFFASENS